MRQLGAGLAIVGIACLALVLALRERAGPRVDDGSTGGRTRAARAGDGVEGRAAPASRTTDPSARLVGFVHDALDGAPVPGARILLLEDGRHAETLTDESGVFRLLRR